MKRFQHYFLLFILSITIAFQSCSSSRNISIPIYVPPIVDVPDHIKSVGVINRTQPKDNKGNQALNTIEGILTGEGLFEDREGAKACMSGAATHLNMDTFVTAQVMDTVMIPGVGSGVMAAPLEWALVDTICGKYGKDALLVLEVFDTDQNGSVTSQAVGEIATTIITGGQHQPRMPSSSANQRVRVKMAWRLYDAKTNQILDQIRMEDWFRVWGNSGNPIYDLGEFAKRDAIQQTAFVAGRSYCTRLFPSWVRVGRKYYRRKGGDMKAAARMVEVNDWQGAFDIWTNLAEQSPKRKIAGRACYNIALFHELEGRLDQAIQWAQRAYTLHRINDARDYVRILNRRKQMELEYQQRENN